MANIKTTEKKTKSQSMGMNTEVLAGRTQQKIFNPDVGENLYYFGIYDVDINKRTNSIIPYLKFTLFIDVLNQKKVINKTINPRCVK